MSAETRLLSFGEKAVGWKFDPSGESMDQKLKELYAKIIDLCNTARAEAGHGEKGRLYSVAITEAQAAQMWAAKAATWED